MTIELSKEEKISIINQHIKTLKYNKYDYQISIKEEEAVATPSTSRVDSLNEKITEVDAKVAALSAEIAALNA
jgi:prefoldin subunit 5